MTALPPGERLVRCLLGQDVDRVPFGVNIGWWPWGDALERWKRESGRAELDLARDFGYDRSFAQPDIRLGIWPEYERAVLQDDGEFEIVRTERGITQRQRKDGLSMPEFLEYPVKIADDWERLKTERLDPRAAGRIPRDWNTFRARLKETGEGVQVGWYPYGVFGTVRDLLGVERLLVAFYDQPELVRDIMEHLTGLWLHVWEAVAAEVQIDHIHIWEDMSGRQGSLISPTMVRDFMLPCYDRIAAFAGAHGVRLISVDTDGDCRELVPLMTARGVNVFFPFEVQAGNDILDYRRRYPALGIMCGLDKRALAGTRADVEREIDRAAAMLGQGRYVPGFDHLIPPDAKWANVQYAAERIRALCQAAGSAGSN